jgi:branched-chain amino acid transport system permease protein
MDLLIQQTLNAISLGGTYAMLALGLAVIFSVMGMINFAHGDLMTLSGYAYVAASLAGAPFAVSVLAALCAGTIAAAMLERIAFRPLRNAGPMTLLISSFAVSIILQILFQSLISPRPQPAVMPGFFSKAIEIGGFLIGSIQATSIIVTGITLFLLLYLFKKTMLGISIRAAAIDFPTTRLMGVRANLVISASFGISGLLAAISGILWIAQRGSVDPYMGIFPVLKAFIAAILGGMGSLPGAVVGGFALGSIEIALQSLLPTSLLAFKDPFTLLIVIAILVRFPLGLIPVKQSTRP